MKVLSFFVVVILFASSAVQAQVDLYDNGSGAYLDGAVLRLSGSANFYNYIRYQPQPLNLVEIAGATGGRLGSGSSNFGSYVEALRWNGAGSVGIGTTDIPYQLNSNNQPYRLFVKGGIKTEEVKIVLHNGTSWPDYVFTKEYKLTSLEEVEQHIQDKGHLHKVASAEELHKEGLELKSMTINQQEKIEELYLHLIDMNKRLKALEEENAALKAQVNTISK